MTDQILPYYNRELAFLRKLGAEFSEAHPKIAGRLKLGGEIAEDPHVARMIEAFAYLTARIRHKLDDDFPELTEAVLGILYPHYLAPMPSMSVVQFELDKTQTELTAGYRIARGASLETEPVRGHGVDGETCHFRTCYETMLWPMTLQSAEFRGPPFTAPPCRFVSEAKAIVRLQLATLAPNVAFHQFQFDRLRFFLQAPAQYVYQLYEAILNNTLAVAVASSAGDREAVLLPRTAIQPVGFERDEALVPYSPRSFDGYRILSEFFIFPDKYLFFDIRGFDGRALGRLGNRLELFLFLNRHVPDLEKNVDASTFQLGATPVVNLYRQRAEPIPLSQTQFEYRVVPDARRPLAHEVYSVDRVVATSPQNEQLEFYPFYSTKHGLPANRQRAFWYAARRPAGYAAGQVDGGTEMFLSVVDPDFRPSAPAKWTLDVETTCLNRDLPRRLPYGSGQPRLQLTTGAPLGRLRCLVPLSETQRPALQRGTLWRLISHLSLNHLSLVSDDNSPEALREILRLYDYHDSPETRAMIEGIASVRGRRVTGRVTGGAAAGFCRGLEISIGFQEERFSGSGVYLFAAVLERFLGLYASLNSFTRVIATTNKREEPLAKWPPRAGEQVVI
ncbi:MAG: type VI secretion system baseplate subunit TssF [Pirellulaceae bacterium]